MDKIFEYAEENYPEICDWFTKRGLAAPKENILPKTGYIAKNVACGFIYMTDSSVAILDCFIANPDSSKEDRDNALDIIVLHLTNYARMCGCKLLICNSKIGSIGSRALKWGFRETGEHRSFAKEI